DHRGEPALLRHAPHHDEVVAGLPVGAEHVGDPLVHVGGQPPVEPHLLVGDGPPGLAGGEVQEAEVHRFAQLDRPVAEQEHHGRVRLPDLCPRSHGSPRLTPSSLLPPVAVSRPTPRGPFVCFRVSQRQVLGSATTEAAVSDGYADRPIVVGYDGSEGSRQALEWAADEARRRGLPVLVCHALHWPYAFRPVAREVMAEIEQAASSVVEDGVRRAQELVPGVDVRPLLARGTAASVLLDASRDAELTVLGSRGQGGFDSLQVGSAAVQVPAYSAGPVVVVRPSRSPGGREVRIVTGMDGSPPSLAAFDFALDEAALRGGTVHVLCCWADRGSASWPDALPFVDSHALRR